VRPDAAASITPAVHDAVDALTRQAHRRGLSAAALALGWVLAANPVVRPIVGPSRLAHLEAVEQALALRLPSEEWVAIASPFAIAEGA
jgi:aryl-alcohol dehydrogenase-like predicted oxidoreductase